MGQPTEDGWEEKKPMKQCPICDRLVELFDLPVCSDDYPLVLKMLFADHGEVDLTIGQFLADVRQTVRERQVKG